jgi:large subunit ribosomal protein L32
MANPKFKLSRSRVRHRRNNAEKIDLNRYPNYSKSICSNCGNPKLSHFICQFCGYYDDKLVINPELTRKYIRSIFYKKNYSHSE